MLSSTPTCHLQVILTLLTFLSLGIAQTSLALHSLTRKVRAISEGINSVYATPMVRLRYALPSPFHLPSNKGAQRSTKGVIHIHCPFFILLDLWSSLLPLGNNQTSLLLLSLIRRLLWKFLLTHFLSAATQEVAEFHEAALEDAANLQLFLVLSNHCWRHAVLLSICAV